MSALLATDTEFMLWLKRTDDFVSALEWSYQANHESMIENYSRLLWPSMTLEDV